MGLFQEFLQNICQFLASLSIGKGTYNYYVLLIVTKTKVFLPLCFSPSNKLLTELIKKVCNLTKIVKILQTCRGAILEHISVKLTMSLKNIVTLLKNSAGICCLFLSFSATGCGNNW